MAVENISGQTTVSSHQSLSQIYRDVTGAAALGLGINLLLAAMKMAGGIVGHSFALIADGFNSLSDAVTSVVVLFALWFAQRPADAEHPYGHTRAESIAASNVALIIILTALGLGWKAIQRTGMLHPMPPLWTLWLAGSNALIKEGLYQYKLRVGRRTGSTAIIANAWDHRSDALCSLAVLLGLAVTRWGGEPFLWADALAAVVVVAAIFWSGCKLFRTSASELMDVQADADLVQRIRAMAITVAGVRGVETLWVRKSGLEYFVDIHLEVDGDRSVADGHRIGHEVKERLVRQFPAVRDVLVHLEPFPGHRGRSRAGSPAPADSDL